MYCPCDQACQVPALQGTPCYLENLIIDDKFINNRARVCIHQTFQYVIASLRNGCLITLKKKKNKEVATVSAKAVTGGAL